MLKRSKTDEEIGSGAGGTGAVLVVDEDRDAGELIARILEAAGFRARRLTDLAEVEPVLDEEPIQAVVIDSLRSGVPAAFKLLDDIRAGGPDVRDTAVVILAATDTNRLFAYQSGADGFGVRPLHATDLVDLVRTALSRDPEERVEYRRAQLLGGATTA